MRVTPLLSRGAAIAAILVSPAVASAQLTGRDAPSSPASTSIDVTPYAGYMMFGDLADGPLGTSLSNAPAPIIGVQLGYRIAPHVSVIGNIAGANSEIKAGIPFLGGVTLAETSTILYDVGFELRATPTAAYGYNFIPFVQGGVGGMHYEITQSGMNTTATNLAGNVGVGADLALGTGMSLRLMARDYIGKFNFQDATSLDITGGTTSNYALSAGVRLSF
jgi:hypothetical protein